MVLEKKDDKVVFLYLLYFRNNSKIFLGENHFMEKKTGEGENLILEVWFALKRSIVLVLAIVIVATFVGLMYGLTKKPNYTATQEIVFTAIDEQSDDIVTNYRVMEALRGTIVDFCDEGVVVDRADFYYVTYIQKLQDMKGGEQYTIDDYIYEIQNTEDPYHTSDPGIVNRGYITRDNVYVSASVEMLCIKCGVTL